VGDPREREVDVRVIAATNRLLEQDITRGIFRKDLFYRLLVFPVDVPPLRERADDIVPLVHHFLTALGRPGTQLPAVSLTRMRAYPWPGNVRELRNLIERAHILAGTGDIGDEHILIDVARSDPTADEGDRPGADLNLDNNARRLIQTAIERAGGNKSLAARMLGITRRTLYSRLKLLGIDGQQDQGSRDQGSRDGEHDQ
jgi:DNA-binding NtrC family response regulator